MRAWLLTKNAHRLETAITCALALTTAIAFTLLINAGQQHFQLTITLSAATLATGQIFDLAQYWASGNQTPQRFPVMAPAVIAMAVAMAGMAFEPQGWQFHAWAAFTILAMLSLIIAMLVRDQTKTPTPAGMPD